MPLGRLDRLRYDARVGGCCILAATRCRLAVARQIGFEQLPLRGRFPLQCAQPDLVFTRLGGRRLQRVELRHKLALAQPPDIGLVFEAAENLLRFADYLRANTLKLGFQCLQAWMPVKQGRWIRSP
jgi:hypothetical protein